LYRMMGGKHLVSGKPLPVYIADEADLIESIAKMETDGWTFTLAAGIFPYAELED